MNDLATSPLQRPVLTWDEDSGAGDQPYSTAFQDHYFSAGKGREETRFVFLDCNDLPARWSGERNPVIGELGFGTGLSFLETWRLWCAHRKDGQCLTFQSVEAFPMTRDEATRAAAGWDDLEPWRSRLLGQWDTVFNGPIQLDLQTQLHVVADDVAQALPRFEAAVDTWFLDGFAPARNPAMWSADVMALLAGGSAPNARFASYTAAGWVRQNLRDAGFQVERRAGFGNKRHMIVGHLKEPS